MAKNSTTWKNWERFVAGIFGWKRNPLSGMNNRHDDGEPTVGDVRVPAEYRNLNIECKHRKRMAVVKMFEDIKATAPTKTLILFLHELRQSYQSSLVVMDVETFEKMWSLCKEQFQDVPLCIDCKKVPAIPQDVFCYKCSPDERNHLQIEPRGNETEETSPKETEARRERQPDPQSQKVNGKAARSRRPTKRIPPKSL